MLVIWGSLAGLLLYLEVVYHLSSYGWGRCNPLYTIFLIIAWSAGMTVAVGVLRGRMKKIFYYVCLWFTVIWTGTQVVYLRIFKQPLLWEALFRSGGDALTNYWREALEGILGALPILLFLLAPPIVIGILLHRKKWVFPQFSSLHIMRTAVVGVIGIAGCVVVMQLGSVTEQDYYEDYQEFYDPLTVAETMGVWPMLERDTVMGVERLAVGFWHAMGQQMAQTPDETAGQNGARPGDAVSEGVQPEDASGTDAAESEASAEAGTGAEEETAGGAETGTGEETAGGAGTGTGEETAGGTGTGAEAIGSAEDPEPEAPPAIDFELLWSLAENDKQTWLAEYMEGLEPVAANEYTGIFEGYNLIYLTAEGFSTYAISQELTPTLYRLTHSGFLFENYYVPLWQTSTSDGEYINCTGLIPDGQFSMEKSSANDMAYTLPRYFAQDGVKSYAYHNNSLSYYDRYLSHPNLGYDFKGCKLGNLSEEEWGGQIFPMENPNAWPASDLEMMQGTIPEYINQDRFHVYYMTVSGHLNYNFKGNAMSYKNRAAVDGLDMSENARAYIACNIELDKALEYLLEQLEAAGKLENTVICLSADHYPYGMETGQYEELAGQSLSEGMDLYRNSLILWNAGMEENPVAIQKACGSMDILPTLLNLFGYSYDSRMYAGRDILSDVEGMVIFNDRSFVTDGVIYRRKDKATIWLKDEAGNDIIPDESKEAYLAEKKQEVKDRYQFSAYVLQENYYADIKQAVTEERRLEE